MSTAPIRVLIVDDSALVRRMLTDALSHAEDIVVVGSARDPYEARERIIEHAPDVITLDIEMPRMDGLTFLEKLMAVQPTRVIIVSSVAEASSANAVRALALGAVEVVSKPEGAGSLPDVERTLVRAIRAASLVDPARLGPCGCRPAGAPSASCAPFATDVGDRRPGPPSRRLIAIGASTGGPRAIERILSRLDATSPGIVMVQHIPPRFTRALAERLDGRGALRVQEAEEGMLVHDGTAYLAPGGWHLLVRRAAEGFVLQLRDGPAVHHQRPSVDVLFDAVARHAGARATGILLTGMGVDGARGLLAMREAGARTIAEDESTCAVFGMPREAIALDAVQEVLPLHAIAAAIRVPDEAPAFTT